MAKAKRKNTKRGGPRGPKDNNPSPQELLNAYMPQVQQHMWQYMQDSIITIVHQDSDLGQAIMEVEEVESPPGMNTVILRAWKEDVWRELAQQMEITGMDQYLQARERYRDTHACVFVLVGKHCMVHMPPLPPTQH